MSRDVFELSLHTKLVNAKPLALIVRLYPERRVTSTAPVDVLWCLDYRVIDMRHCDESTRTQAT